MLFKEATRTKDAFLKGAISPPPQAEALELIVLKPQLAAA
jgi:hypothetical protein